MCIVNGVDEIWMKVVMVGTEMMEGVEIFRGFLNISKLEIERK